MTIDLYFDLPAVLRLAEHATAADDNLPSLIEVAAGQTSGAPALTWVADSGTYLMSNGIPALLTDPHDQASNVVVFADGWGPDSDRHALGASAVGHDDFVEHLALDDGQLLTLLQRAHACDFRWFVLNVTTDQITFRVSQDQRR
ncbi:DUF3085 domain-containing protein [Actinoplanes couchii]|uniref:DUF3085 domain-containing protein n=1 Tax=Actinoplanes couchii TaxID=403638 RepID=A0ABQ3XST4_9ACTN|nr:DUF3085 domain-containing protein [Actinoplanes couchii]MDR6324032.1 hypothetical protein [Actinoplanes couchii]GID61559.1 hypothetical protein Aco03nite_099630 [Actinoplanes couchii]